MEQAEKKYTFRRLNSGDIFPMCSVIGKIGVKELADCFDGEEMKEVLNSFSDDKKNDDAVIAAVGIKVALKIAGKIIENLPKCENEIYQLLSNVSGITSENIKELEIEDFLEMLIDFVKKEEFKNFMKVASKLIKSEK